MKPLGTILPTATSLAHGDAHAASVQLKKKQVAARLLPRHEHRVEGGEDRYYAGADYYAVVSDDLQLRWFIKKPDGHWYAVHSPTPTKQEN